MMESIPAQSTIQKEKKITKHLALMGLAVAFFYLIFDFLFEAYGYLGVYFILIAGCALCLYYLRRNKLLTAKVILITSGFGVITPFSSVETLETGIYFYYVVLALGSFTLFGYRHLYWAVGYSILSVLLFAFVFFTDIELIPSIDLSEEYIRSSLLFNFMAITLATSVMMFYLIRNNHKAEQTLLEQKSDLAKTADELERSQRQFELAIQGSSAAIWDWDIKKDVLYVSPKLAEIMDRPYEKIQRTTRDQFIKAIHPEDIPTVMNRMEEYFMARDNFELEFRLRKGSGGYVWVLDTGQAEWDRNGEPVRMVGTIVNIHDKKLATERVHEQNEMLAKANEELDRFVYSTSHDLRAPLSSLLGLINLASLSTEKSDRDELINMMKNQIVKLDSYIQDITDYSRNARVNVEYKDINVREILYGCIEDHKFMDGASGIDIQCEVEEDMTVYTDKERFKVIINNLISNAIKYQDVTKESFLKINAHPNGKADILTFHDNGIGIEAEHVEKVFDMFYRASDKSRGSGLGLYIAKEISNKIDANLTVQSQIGEGTTFKISLPTKESVLA